MAWELMDGVVWNAEYWCIIPYGSGWRLFQESSYRGTYDSLEEAQKAAEEG